MSFTEQQTELLARTTGLIDFYETAKDDFTAAKTEALEALKSNAELLFIDPVNGNDDAVGKTKETALRTLDRALEITVDNVAADFVLLGNVTLTKSIGTNLQNIYMRTENENDVIITFLPEAINSPDDRGKRQQAGIVFYNPVEITTYRVGITVPMVASEIDYHTCLRGTVGSIRLIMHNSDITAENSNTEAVLLDTWSPAPIEFWADAVAIANEAKGHVIEGVGAGENPNVLQPQFRSNYTQL